MALIVQKYGGTSVGNPERIKNVARRVLATQQAGNQVVVVVSAMSGVTDALIKLAQEVHPEPNEREMDVLLATGEQTTIALLAMALQGLGAKAASLTGAQAGIVTDGLHTKAKIANITPKRVHELLNAGHVVIIAGFQDILKRGLRVSCKLVNYYKGLPLSYPATLVEIDRGILGSSWLYLVMFLFMLGPLVLVSQTAAFQAKYWIRII